MKTGRMKKEGWWRKVFSILQCQVETRAVTRPGISTVAMGKTMAMSFMSSRSRLKIKTAAIAQNFVTSVKKLAKNRRRNLQETPSGSILQGPVVKAFDKPKVADRKEIAYVTAKKALSEPTISNNGGSRSSLLAFTKRE